MIYSRNMADSMDISQLERALINADKAGDSAAATRLAQEIQSMRQAPKEDSIGRQLGLTARSAIEGPIEAIGVFSNPIAYAMNKAGMNVPYAAETGSALADMAGLPTPETKTEKIANFGSNLLSGIGSQAAIARQGAKVTSGFANDLMKYLAGQPIQSSTDRIRQSVSPAVRTMLNEGVTPTPGQIIGGTAKRAEEAARSVPLLGDAIAKAQTRGIEQFNKAAINRALAPIGESIDDVGYGAVAKAQSTISQAYDDLLPKLNVVSDDVFVNDVVRISDSAKEMVPARAKQLGTVIDDIISKFDSSGKMTSEAMKTIDSKIGRLASDGMKSMDMDQQQLGRAALALQGALRSMVERANPEKAGQLQKINQSYANLLRVENAAARQGAKGGIFTPNQLEAATRAMDSSLRKRASAQGKALMQDLATAGDEVITNKLPSSGTFERTIFNAGALGAGYIDPSIPVSLLAGAGLYTKPAQKLIAGLLTSRGPEAIDPITRALSASAPIAGGLLAQ